MYQIFVTVMYFTITTNGTTTSVTSSVLVFDDYTLAEEAYVRVLSHRAGYSDVKVRATKLYMPIVSME